MPETATGRIRKEALPPAGMRGLTREGLKRFRVPPVLADAHVVPFEQKLLISQQTVGRVLSQRRQSASYAQERRKSLEAPQLQPQQNDDKVRIVRQIDRLPRYGRLHLLSRKAYNAI